MKYNAKYIDQALYIAHRSPFRGYHTGAVIVLKDEIVSTGWSHMSNLRLKETWSMHAEIHALGRARHLDLADAHIYVANVRATSGRTALGKPCLSCVIALLSAGVTDAWYSTSECNYSQNFGVQQLRLTDDLKGLKVYTQNGEA